MGNDQEGTAAVVVTLTGTRRKLFPLLARYCGLWGSNYSWGGVVDLEPGVWMRVYSYDPEDVNGDPITGRGFVHLAYREIDSPSSATIAWNWYSPPLGVTHTTPDEASRVLAHDTTVRLSLTQSASEDGTATTRAHVTHEGLPSAWSDHMTAWWTWRLARIEQTGVALR